MNAVVAVFLILRQRLSSLRASFSFSLSLLMIFERNGREGGGVG
jgi:hypothetical protein